MKAGAPFQRESLTTTNYSLLNRLQNWDDHESWTIFFDRYWRLIYSLAVRAGLNHAEAQDVVQETTLQIARNISKFECKREMGTFRGWLRNLTRWRIADQLRKRDKAARQLAEDADGGLESDLEEFPDSSAIVDTLWEEEWQTNLLEVAMERVRAQIKEEQYQIFDLYVVKRWKVSDVSRRLGVSVGRIYLTKHRVSAVLKKEIKQLKKTL